MENLNRILRRIAFLNYYKTGKDLLTDASYIYSQKLDAIEEAKLPSRTTIINFLLSQFTRETAYLEIGVRNPDDNFNHVVASKKVSVDPGLEFKSNPVDFKMTSDEFFRKLENKEILTEQIQFDVIFIDGLHLAEQTNKDIQNALKYLKDDGFIVLHDCNPPTAWHTREFNGYPFTPAGWSWNGTTWKAFMKWRYNPKLQSCCIDSDWGVGVLSKTYPIGKCIQESNTFFEFSIFEANRKEYLNLIDFENFKKLFVEKP